MMNIEPSDQLIWSSAKQWHPFVAMDWGSSAPACAYLCGRSPGIKDVPAGSLVLLDEVHSAVINDPNQGLGWPPAMLTEAIIEMCDKWGVQSIRGCGDDAYGIDDSLLEIFQRDHHIYLVKPRKTRVSGWQKMRELLFNASEQNGRPGMYINQVCRYFWETVPFLPRDPRRPEDVDTSAADHAADAARYACMYTPNTITSIPW